MIASQYDTESGHHESMRKPKVLAPAREVPFTSKSHDRFITVIGIYHDHDCSCSVTVIISAVNILNLKESHGLLI